MEVAETVELKSGNRILVVTDGEGRVHGNVERLADGRVRVWKQVWSDAYEPTDTIFPGFVSAVRALVRGEA